MTAHAPLGTLRKGTLSPVRPVPASIARPEYVGRAEPNEGGGNDLYTPEEIERIRAAGTLAANALAVAGALIAPGATTDALDAAAHEYLCDMGAYPSCLDYRGFPKSICTSVNEVICHGIPDSTVLAEGDIVNLDITAYKDGMHGDTNFTFEVGEVDGESHDLIVRTYEAMMRGIKAVRPGREVNVIGRVIEKYAKRFGYGVVRDFTGHGVGREFHSGLVIPHYDAAPQHAEVIEPGMVFTIEPMLDLGTEDWEQWDDGWTVVTADRKRSAQFEHTLVATEDGAEILTLPDAEHAAALTL
ncbi:type I methionyl aminopeptidase [Brevibacterium sp. 5221]|uniref:Methionine aminopeptidase n=1 Tax=Brevibacterium rongguiense TaxID=2695267 RepID=A0A6N9H5U0_9MICO|nr:type I methionyl aminopeptidase [Brevibacterium rongguiense]MYM18994.1 type I methionyl aminopeptidase [Brevibacterium rongguiense]